MDLPELIKRYARGRSLRAMAQQAADASNGRYTISHVQLGEYAKGNIRAIPSEATRHAIAAALFGEPDGAAFDEVTAAAWRSAVPDAPEISVSQHALAFMRLTDGRTDDEIRQTLRVVEATLRAMEASRAAVESSDDGTNVPDSA